MTAASIQSCGGASGDFCRKATVPLVITFVVTICYAGVSLISSCRFSSKYDISLPVAYTSLVEGDFVKSMYISWGGQHSAFLGNGDEASLVLDQISGSGTQSKRSFLFGSFEMQIKLIPGNSAGTVVAYYLSSTGEKHDEIDFEFLGNVSGEPYIIHTNIFTQGAGGREQQFYPWFDPTSDYHNYTIHWNPYEVVWYVDSIPIRVYRNYKKEGIPYPKMRGMKVYSSIWNADSWATRGGLDKIDWVEAPFIAGLRHFRARACKYNGKVNVSQCTESSLGNWWNSNEYSKLNSAKQDELKWVRDKYLVYDYCKDIEKHNGLLPGETAKQIIQAIDERDRIEFKIIHGDFMKLYKDMIITISIEKKTDNIDLTTWTLEYETVGDDVEHPMSLLVYFTDISISPKT